MTIPFSRPSFCHREAEASAAAVASGWVVGGPQLRELEARFAAHCGTAHGVGVSSWTTGAFLVLKALGIGEGDEVIVPSLTFIASVNVIRHAGATPVFADIDPDTLNVTPEAIEKQVTSRTKAIMPVDQLGLPCEIDQIMRIAEWHRLHVIQDAACAIGSSFREQPVGAMAPVTVFSLHARKIVTTGEGGMVVTNDADLAATLRLLRHQGMSVSDYARHGQSPANFESYGVIGYNARMTDIQAAIGNVQMDKLPDMLRRRDEIACRYIAALSKSRHIIVPTPPSHLKANWQSFQIHIADSAPVNRNQLLELMFEKGISCRRGVMASHRETPYAHMSAVLPHTEWSADTGFQLPIFPDLTDAEADKVTRTLLSVLS